MIQSEYGLYGLGVMGQSLSKNILRQNYTLSVYNYDHEITEDFVRHNSNQNLSGFKQVESFVKSIKKPRKIVLIVTAGDVTKKVIKEISSYLEKGDTILNFANSFYEDANEYQEILNKINCNYVSVGISGGELGALNGACLMPSGKKEIISSLQQFLNSISAITEDNNYCANYVGTGTSGHYVKMVHNGIEYGDIQLICDIYEIMRKGLKKSNWQMADIFKNWNKGKLNSYLIEITESILNRKENDEYLIDKIIDVAKSKGTGKWTSIESMNLGVSIPTIVEAMNARYLSEKKQLRDQASTIYKETSIDRDYISEKELENSLYICKILCYSQGFELLNEANKKNIWGLNLNKIALNWKAGCIIRAKLLDDIANALDDGYENIILNEKFYLEIKQNIADLRKVVIYSIKNGIYVPSLVNSLEYFDGLTTKESSANLIQAQRDCFGAHTYQRFDKDGDFHTVWE